MMGARPSSRGEHQSVLGVDDAYMVGVIRVKGW